MCFLGVYDFLPSLASGLAAAVGKALSEKLRGDYHRADDKPPIGSSRDDLLRARCDKPEHVQVLERSHGQDRQIACQKQFVLGLVDTQATPALYPH
jgi:hypothetical protein